jgi:hypothetical protein
MRRRTAAGCDGLIERKGTEMLKIAAAALALAATSFASSTEPVSDPSVL